MALCPKQKYEGSNPFKSAYEIKFDIFFKCGIFIFEYDKYSLSVPRVRADIIN